MSRVWIPIADSIDAQKHSTQSLLNSIVGLVGVSSTIFVHVTAFYIGASDDRPTCRAGDFQNSEREQSNGGS